MSATGERLECDTSDMVVIHRIFRMVFSEAPAIVRAAPTGDSARATFVADHVLSICDTLHSHHHGEDVGLWDLLSERSPGCAIHVELMRRQHAEMGEWLDRVSSAALDWRTTAAAADAETLAVQLDGLVASLERHLGDEESLILPAASTAMTQKEWGRLGEHARKEIPPSRIIVQLGFMIDALGPVEGQRFLETGLPAPLRAAWSLIGRRKYARYRSRLYADLDAA